MMPARKRERPAYSKIEGIFAEVWPDGQARELAARVPNEEHAKRLVRQMQVGEELEVWRKLPVPVTYPERYVLKIVRRDHKHSEAGLLPWFLNYEKTGSIAGNHFTEGRNIVKKEVSPSRACLKFFEASEPENPLSAAEERFNALPEGVKAKYLAAANKKLGNSFLAPSGETTRLLAISMYQSARAKNEKNR